jgi:undecaprenyl-diphosphatase
LIEFFVYIDRLLFSLFNRTIANPVFDVLMPFITDLNKHTVSFIIVGLILIYLMIWGGKTGRIVVFGLILVVTLADQLNSSVLKSIFYRPRPCHFVNDIFNIEHIRLLVGCGGGRSFPSSHAANNAAVATFLSFYYGRYKWWFIGIAGTIGFSRIYVGVHFPSDVLAGFLVGIVCGYIIIAIMVSSDWIYTKLFKQKKVVQTVEEKVEEKNVNTEENIPT